VSSYLGFSGPRPCPCGSSERSYILSDARGIPCGRVCNACVVKVKAKYRPEIFADSRYDTMGEHVEEDE
jgi:hypothetical protein